MNRNRVTAADLHARIGAVADRLDGRLGAALTFLPTGDSVFVSADETFPTASVIKVAIVAELFTQAAEGRLSLDEPVTVRDENLVPGSGVLALLRPGLILPLADLALLAITVSDNTASNLCLRAVGGPDAVNARMRACWNMAATTIHRPIRFHLAPPDPPHTATGTPRDQLNLMVRLAEGRIGPHPDVARDVLRLLAETQDSSMIPRHLHVSRHASALGQPAPPFVVRHKTGGVTGVRNDAGLITRKSRDGADETLAVCVFTRDLRDARWTPANAGDEAVAEVARLACEHFFAREEPS